jgi:hypothetical protein
MHEAGLMFISVVAKKTYEVIESLTLHIRMNFK